MQRRGFDRGHAIYHRMRPCEMALLCHIHSHISHTFAKTNVVYPEISLTASHLFQPLVAIDYHQNPVAFGEVQPDGQRREQIPHTRGSTEVERYPAFPSLGRGIFLHYFW